MSKFNKGNNKAAKLTNEQVLVIRDKYWNQDRTQASLAREYGVVPETIGRICRGDSRKSVPEPERELTPQEKEDMLQRLLAVKLQVTAVPEDPFLAPDLALKRFGTTGRVREGEGVPMVQLTPDVIAEDNPGTRRFMKEIERQSDMSKVDRQLDELTKGDDDET